MMDGFIRRVNNILYSRDFQPLKTKTVPARRALVNEAAFSAFCTILSSETPEFTSKAIRQAVEQSGTHILAHKSWIVGPPGEAEDLYDFEIDDAEAQVERIKLKLIPFQLGEMTLRPRFRGCGKIYDCEGDLIRGKCLYEIKAGERNFRSIDIKQALVYCALNKSSRQFDIDQICIFNPRMGISFESNLNNLAIELSGSGYIDLLDKIIFSFSGADISGAKM